MLVSIALEVCFIDLILSATRIPRKYHPIKSRIHIPSHAKIVIEITLITLQNALGQIKPSFTALMTHGNSLQKAKSHLDKIQYSNYMLRYS